MVMVNIFARSTQVVGVLALALSLSLFKDCNSTPPEYEAFYAQSWDRQREEAKNFPIEKQIDYYVAGRRYFHPPYQSLLPLIAERGKGAVPPLIEKMKQADSDSVRLDLLGVVDNIDEFHVDLSDDKPLLDELTGIVNRMTDLDRKAKAQAVLKEIVENKRP
jgi:hypothetical protein